MIVNMKPNIGRHHEIPLTTKLQGVAKSEKKHDPDCIDLTLLSTTMVKEALSH